MARRHILASAVPLFLLALGSSCSSSPPRDMWFGTDAGAGFEAPVVEVAPGSADTSADTTEDTTTDTTDNTTNPDASTD